MDSKVFGIAEKLLSALKKNFRGDYTNVPEVLSFWHNTMYLFFSAVNHHRLTGRADVKYEDMVAWGLMPGYLQAFYEKNKSVIDEHIRDATMDCFELDLEVNRIRQELLNVELDFSNGSLCLFADKVSRDNTGAYYTPKALAEEIVKKAFGKRNLETGCNYQIADLSCGGGDFFLAIMDYFEEKHNIEKSVTVKWLYGVDVDPIALQICITNLLMFANCDDWNVIVSHFSFGNPLILTDGEHTEEKKNNLFATRRLYSVGLGMNEGFFKQQFDIVVGNPPWEKIRFEERKFFRGIDNSISGVSQKSERDKKVNELREKWPVVFDWRNQVASEYTTMTAAKYKHSRINDSVAGELNTYALFTDLAFNMLSENGFLALVVKSTLVTAPVNQKLWGKLLDNKAVSGVFLFENKKKIFSIDSRERFVVIIAGKKRTGSFEFATGLTIPKEIKECDTITLTSDDLRRINPATRTIPNVSNNSEIEFLKKAHEKFKLFSEVYTDCHFGRLIHLTAHAASISKTCSDDNVPIYEGKFLEQYDARYATFHGMQESKKYTSKASAIKNEADENGYKTWPESRFFVDQELWNKYQRQYDAEYSLCWRSLTSPTNRRTMLAMILPTCPTCQSIQLLQTKDVTDLVILLALFNSVPFDYFVRIKMPGLDLTQSVIKQIPVPSESDYAEEVEINGVKCSLRKHILSYAVSILEQEERLNHLVELFDGRVYSVAVNEKFEKQKMIDLLFKRAYHLEYDTYNEILATFPKYQANHIV